MKKKHNNVLTIAGFDGGGGAGIQADLKTFSSLGCYGLSVLTALPIQNTLGVRSIYDIPEQCIVDQLDAILGNFEISVLKIGMLHRSKVVLAIVNALRQYPHIKVILDPVMVSKNGHSLLTADAITTMTQSLFPLTTVITPNVPEAEELLGRILSNKEEVEKAALDLILLGPKAVVIKGGHLSGETCDDCLCIADGSLEFHWFSSRRIDSKNTHGTGCTFSAALAAYLSKGNEIVDSVKLAKDYVSNCLEAGVDYCVGSGFGPCNFT